MQRGEDLSFCISTSEKRSVIARTNEKLVNADKNQSEMSKGSMESLLQACEFVSISVIDA